MLSEEDIDQYIKTIPPIPAIIKECKKALDSGDLIKAAKIAALDKALLNYFQSVVNKPIYGFKDELKNPTQIFGALGMLRVKQMLTSYYSVLIAPKQWLFFNINNSFFYELQASFMMKWEALLKKADIQNNNIYSMITLITASISVCESLFCENKEDIELIMSQKSISYEKILYKLSGYDIFSLIVLIAQKWEFESDIIEIFKTKDEKNEIFSYLILLINYEMSRDMCLKSGINSLFDLNYSFSDQEFAFFYEAISELEHEADY